MSREVTVSACQYIVSEIQSFDDFVLKVRRLLDKGTGSDLIVFPELFTIELFTLSEDWRNKPVSDLIIIDKFTSDYKELFEQEAKKRGLFIAGGSHLEKIKDGLYQNVAHIFGPSGEYYSHAKTHIFPAEGEWFTQEGNEMKVIQLPFCNVGFNICYETEIPECASSLAEQGVELILTPSATFTEQGFWRVRHCGQSRCIENQVYLVHCCLGGNPGKPLPDGWAQSSVLGPCDLPWSNPAGIIAEAPANEEFVITGKLNLDLLYENRQHGTATTFNDRRRKQKLYSSWPSHVK